VTIAHVLSRAAPYSVTTPARWQRYAAYIVSRVLKPVMHNADQSEKIHFKFLLSQENRSLNTFLQLTVTVCRLHRTRQPCTSKWSRLPESCGPSEDGERLAESLAPLAPFLHSVPGKNSDKNPPNTPVAFRWVLIIQYFIRLLLFVDLKYYVNCVNKLLL